MLEKTEFQAGVNGSEIGAVQPIAQTFPDLPKMIEEEKVRDALSVASDVLKDLSESIRDESLINSPDTDRSQGRITADVLDLLSS